MGQDGNRGLRSGQKELRSTRVGTMCAKELILYK